MNTIKTKTKTIPCVAISNMPPEVLALSLTNISFAEAAAIFSNPVETGNIIAHIGDSEKVYVGFTKLGMIRQTFNGLEIGLQK